MERNGMMHTKRSRAMQDYVAYRRQLAAKTGYVNCNHNDVDIIIEDCYNVDKDKCNNFVTINNYFAVGRSLIK